MAIFKARARALDMLGRQQIAGIPTAISELFKNAHDAYAERVEVDYYRSDGLFVLRDDGVGMSKSDFESRWLTLGTESKVTTGAGLSLPPVDPLKPRRHIMGEKGIGRLAIASIGPQVLVLSRAKREGGEEQGELLAAFIHWGLFACPGIDLDQIEIPVKMFPPGTLPNQTDLAKMVDAVRQNMASLHETISPNIHDEILADLDRFTVDPSDMDEVLKEPSLQGNGHGTHFFILPTDESLQADIDGRNDRNDDEASPLIKSLIGFTNTMTPDHNPPNIATAFRDHKREEYSEDLIEQAQFFTPDEFENADHHIRGDFDEYGQFTGTITVYGEPTSDHTVPWLPARGVEVDCGPFRIELAYVQGEAKSSTIPQEQWALISRKLRRMGGLYIYRDGIRVLPYGDSDVDFIDLEKNRSKSAGDYFFSYRRMFGVIQISHERNDNLIEKAGREGFRQNKAYRQFRAILSNFFVQIAAEFFKEDGVRSEVFTTRKKEFDVIDKARKRRDSQVTAQRKAFRQNIDSFFSKLETASPEKDAEQLLTKLENQLDAALAKDDLGGAVTDFIDVEANARKEVEALRAKYRIAKPRGVGLTKQLRRDWDLHTIQMRTLDEVVFEPAAKRVEEIIIEKARGGQLSIDRRRRLERAINDCVLQARKASFSDRKETMEAAEGIRRKVVDLTRETAETVDDVIRDVLSRLSRVNVADFNDGEIIDLRAELEGSVNGSITESASLLQSIRDQIQAMDLARDEENGIIVGVAEVREAIDEELLALRERAEEDFELVQLGMAIEVISHEFSGTVRSIRDNLRALGAWTAIDPDLALIERHLRASFDHLDGYLELFTPLHKRLYRQAIDFTGSDIENFLRRLFRERLTKHQIKLEATNAFLDQTITGYPSTFYPVFVNLVDNALHWVQDRPDPRLVILDGSGDSFLISDTGPGVPLRDRESVFDRGFTRKIGGRGMGLKISKDVLKRVGYSLELLQSPPGQGAIFSIAPIEDDANVEDEESAEKEIG